MSCSSRISRILADGPPLIWEGPLDSPPLFSPPPRKTGFFSFIGNRKREKEFKSTMGTHSRAKSRTDGSTTNLSLPSISTSHLRQKVRASPSLNIETSRPAEEKPLPDLPVNVSWEEQQEQEPEPEQDRLSRRQFSPLPPLVEEPEQERPSTGQLSPPSSADADYTRCRSCPPEYTPRSEVSPLSALTNLISSRDRGQSPISSEGYDAPSQNHTRSPPCLISPTLAGQHQSWPGREGDIDWIAYFRSRPLPSSASWGVSAASLQV